MNNNISHVEPSTTRPQPLSKLVRRHPLVGYFLLAFTLTWIWEILALLVFHLPVLIALTPGPFIGPTFSAFLITALIEGKTGVLHLLRRYIRWHVSWQWYLLVFLGMPALFLLSLIVLPGALAAFQAPTAAFGLSYLALYLNIFFLGGPLGEEPGWRGFALPRLQQRSGPLVGSLVLAVLHGLWHLPLYLFIPGYNGAGMGWLGIGVPFVLFVISNIGLTIIFTWVFNNTRGSLLLTMLLHASINTASQLFLLFPSLMPGWQFDLIHTLVLSLVALLIIVATRGHLSYERNFQQAILSTTAPNTQTQS